jgi:hypothetical protein
MFLHQLQITTLQPRFHPRKIYPIQGSLPTARTCVDTNARWESRALRPGEGALPGRYRVRPSRTREGSFKNVRFYYSCSPA